MTDLRPLLARLEAATGPDRKLDGDLFAAIEGWELPAPRWLTDGAPALTASIDASLALVEKKLPGWGVQVGHPLRRSRGGIWKEGEPDTGWYASVFRERGSDEALTGDGWCFSQSPAGAKLGAGHRYSPNGSLAILIALLRALISNQTDPGKDEA